MRKFYILGNWKMHKTLEEAIETARGLEDKLKDYQGPYIWGIAPPYPYLPELRKVVKQGLLGAQNSFYEKEGAFTGEVSAYMLSKMGIDFVIVGHSERRQIFGETNEIIAKKVKAVIEEGLIPVLCIGETLQQREKGETEAVLKRDLTESLKLLEREEIYRVIIAYEPVWAIGTGKTATPEMAQEAHSFIRGVLKGLGIDPNKISILYGGSVKPHNINELTRMPDIDGALVGGASLKVDSFTDIIQNAFPKS